MDFHGMKRKQLQALCKKHGVPANLTNLEMADRLASSFKENEDPVLLEKLSTNSEEIGSENEAKVVEKQLKKVRFSPENQTFEYEVSIHQRPRTRSRKQKLSKNPAHVIENAPNSEDISEVEGCQVRVTRSRVQNAVEDDISTCFSPPVARKRGRRGKKNKDVEMTNMGSSEVLELGQREDVKNGDDQATAGLSGRQLRSRKNVTQEDSKKIRNGKRGDEIHLLDESVLEDAKSKNGPKQLTRNARKEDWSAALNSEVEKVEVVPRVTRQSRAQSKDVASMVKNEVKIVRVKGGCEEVLQLKQPQKVSGKNGLRQNAMPQRTTAEGSLLAGGRAQAEKPMRRSKRNSEKACAKNTTVKSETQVTKVLEQSERDIALVEQPECLSRYSSRRNSVVSQSGNGGNKEEFLKKETGKRIRTTELDEIVEHSTSQHQAPLRRSRRKTVVLNARALTDAKLANKEDIGKMEQLRAPLLGNDMNEELPRKSSRNSSRYALSGTSKEDQIAVAKNDQGVKQQMKEPILEEEITSVPEHHSVIEKPQRRSDRITSTTASVAPSNPTAKGVEKKRQSKSRRAIKEKEAALIGSLPAPGELPGGRDELLLVSERAGNKNELDLNVSKQAVKNAEASSNKRRKGLRGNSGVKKQCGFVEASPLFLDMEECKDSAGNMEETLIAKSVKLVGPSTDQEMKQSSHKSVAVYEKESNLVGEDIEKLVHGGNVESEVVCMSSQSVNTTCVFDDANCSDPKGLKFESYGSHMMDSSEITFSAESRGKRVSDQETKKDIRLIDAYSAHESLVVYKENRILVESDKERLVEVELESNVINMDSSEITSIANGLSLADQRDLGGSTSTFFHSEKELGTEPPGAENTNLASDNVNADDSRNPFGEAQILVKLKDAIVTAAEAVKEEVFNLNEFGESSGLKSELENSPKKAEEMIANDFPNREGIPHRESSVEATENQESIAWFHFATAETDAQKIFEIQQSSYSNTAAPESPCGPAPGKQCKTSSSLKLDEVLETEQPSENTNSINNNMDAEGIRTSLAKDQMKGQLRDVNATVGDSVEEAIFKDLLSELGESTGLKRESEIPLKKSEKLSATKLSDGEGITLIESYVKAEKQEYRAEIDVVAAITGTPNTTAMKCSPNSDTATCETPFGPAPQSQDKLCSAGITVSIAGSKICNQHVETSLVEDDEEILLQDDTIEGETKNQPFLSLNKTVASNDALVEFANNADKGVCSGMTSLADVYSSANQMNFAGETSNELKPLKVLDLEESARGENVYGSDEIEVEDDIILAQEDQNSMHLEDANITAAEPAQDVVLLDRWNKFCESCSKRGFEVSLKKADETAIDDSSAIGMVQTESSVEINEMREASGQKTIMEIQRSLSSHDNDLISPLRPQVGSQDVQGTMYRVETAVNNEDNVKIVENEHQETLNTEKELFFSGKKIIDDSSAIEMVQTESSVEINEMREATGQKTIMAMQRSLSSPDKDLISPLRPQVGSQDVQGTTYRVETAVCHEENVKIVENELQEMIETEKESFSSGKRIIDDSSAKEVVQTESSVEINEMSEATGQRTIMAMQQSLSSHDKDLISPLRPEAGSQDVQATTYGVETAISHEENVKIMENEHQETMNTEKEWFFSRKKIIDESSEGKFREDGVCDPFSESIDSHCAKDKNLDISDGSFNNVSGEKQEKCIFEVSDGEETDPVSSEEKGICNKKLPFNGYLPVSNDMQEKSEAVSMDKKNMRNEIPANNLPQLELERLDNDWIAPTSEPFSMRPLDQALVDGERNASGERVMDHPFIKDFAATMGRNGTRVNRETMVGQEDNIVENIAILALKVEVVDYSDGNADAELYETNMSDTETIPPETDAFGVVSTDCPEEMSNAPPCEGTENYYHDDPVDEVRLERDCSSSLGLDCLKSTVGINVDNISVVGTLESTLNSNDPQSGIKLDDPDVNDSDAAKQFDTAFTIEEAGVEDAEKTLASNQISLHGGKQEDVSSYSIGKEGRREAMDDINDLGGTEISIDCKVTREERDGYQKNAGGFSDVTDVSFVEKSMVDLEEIAESKSDDCEGSMKRVTAMDSIDSLVVNQSPCLDERKSCELETEEPHTLDLPENIAGGSREVGNCSKLDIVSSMKPEMVEDCCPVSSICATSDEDKHQENPDGSNILTNMEMSLFFEDEDEVKKPDAKVGDSDDVALDKAITESNSSDIKEEDYVARSDVGDTKLSVKKDGPPEDIEETTELRKDFSGLDAAATADKSPLLKNSEIGKVVEGKEAFRTELNLLNASAKKEGSNSVSVKQLISSIMKSKSKFGLIQRTPKRAMILQDMKENEGRHGASSKREQIGNITTPKTSSKRRPLERI